MKDIKPILRALGLLDSEVKTYLKALESGPSTVLELAQATKLSRQATYTAIQSLTRRGLVSSAEHGKKHLYAAEHPEKLLVYAERSQAELREYADDLKRALPELELQVGGDRPIVKVFEGKEGINAIMADIQTTRHKIAEEIADVDAMFAVIDKNALHPMRGQLKKFGTKVRGLYGGTLHANDVKSERYVLPKDLAGFKANIGIYGNKIALVTFEGKMHSIMIESEALTKTLHILFDLAFETAAKKFK
ncbi:MAG: helix-turn-helix domain-containing protein [Patescibacteria group bacterium]